MCRLGEYWGGQIVNPFLAKSASKRTLQLEQCSIVLGEWQLPANLNIYRAVVSRPLNIDEIPEMIKRLNPAILEFFKVRLWRSPLFIEAAVLNSTRTEYFRVDILGDIPRAWNHHVEQFRLSLQVVIHYFLALNRKATVVFDSTKVFSGENMFLPFMLNFREQANFYCIDRERFALHDDWMCVFGGLHNLTIRDIHHNRR